MTRKAASPRQVRQEHLARREQELSRRRRKAQTMPRYQDEKRRERKERSANEEKNMEKRVKLAPEKTDEAWQVRQEYVAPAATREPVRRAERRKKKGLALWSGLMLLVVLGAAGVLIFMATQQRIREEERAESLSALAEQAASAVVEEPEVLGPSDPDLWSLLLANTTNPLPEGYAPELASVGYDFRGIEQFVDERIQKPLLDMLAAAEADGVHLQVRSAYRSHESQTILFESMKQDYIAQGYTEEEAYAATKKWRNVPGTSEHETGLAADIVAVGYGGSLDSSLEQTPEAQWLYENAADYGFILRYPKDKTEITGTSFEPWHYRYVGVEDAQKIMDAGVCLEEYLGKVE